MRFSEYQEEEKRWENRVEKTGVNWLQLKNDGDSITGFVMVEDFNHDDHLIEKTHVIKIGNSKFDTKIKCLRDENSSECPLCSLEDESGRWVYPPRYKAFIPFYDTENNKALLWERSTKMLKQFQTATSNFNKINKANYNVEDLMFLITRSGSVGSKETTYTPQAFLPSDEEIALKKECMVLRPPINGDDNTFSVIRELDYDKMKSFIVENNLDISNKVDEVEVSHNYPISSQEDLSELMF